MAIFIVRGVDHTGNPRSVRIEANSVKEASDIAKEKHGFIHVSKADPQREKVELTEEMRKEQLAQLERIESRLNDPSELTPAQLEETFRQQDEILARIEKEKRRGFKPDSMEKAESLDLPFSEEFVGPSYDLSEADVIPNVSSTSKRKSKEYTLTEEDILSTPTTNIPGPTEGVPSFDIPKAPPVEPLSKPTTEEEEQLKEYKRINEAQRKRANGELPPPPPKKDTKEQDIDDLISRVKGKGPSTKQPGYYKQANRKQGDLPSLKEPIPYSVVSGPSPYNDLQFDESTVDAFRDYQRGTDLFGSASLGGTGGNNPPPPPPMPPSGPDDEDGGDSRKRRRKGKGAGKQKSLIEKIESMDMETLQSMQAMGGKGAEAASLMQTGVRAAAGDPLAAMQLILKAAENFQEQMSEAGKDVKKAVTSERMGGVASGAFGSIEHVGSALSGIGGGAPSMAMEYLGKFGKALGDSLESIRNWTEQLHESNMKFAEFSASMAQVQAEQQIRDIYLSQERGERRADPAQALAESKSRLERTIAPWEDKWANFKAEVMAPILNLLTGILEKIPGAGGGKEEYIPGTFGDTFYTEDLVKATEDWFEKHGRPPWMPR